MSTPGGYFLEIGVSAFAASFYPFFPRHSSTFSTAARTYWVELKTQHSCPFWIVTRLRFPPKYCDGAQIYSSFSWNYFQYICAELLLACSRSPSIHQRIEVNILITPDHKDWWPLFYKYLVPTDMIQTLSYPCNSSGDAINTFQTLIPYRVLAWLKQSCIFFQTKLRSTDNVMIFWRGRLKVIIMNVCFHAIHTH